MTTRLLHALLLAALPALLGASCSRAPRPEPGAGTPGEAMNALTDAERAAGWRLLFDGRTTRGWRGFQKREPPAAGRGGTAPTPAVAAAAANSRTWR